jgi:hypothetical protein
MVLFETLLQDARHRARTLLRDAGFTTRAIFALALSIGVTTVDFTAYKAFVARPINARDPSTLVNFAMRLHYGARFSYSDYESYRDHLHSFTGVIAFSIHQLRLGAGGSGRRAAAGSWLGRLGLLSPTLKISS